MIRAEWLALLFGLSELALAWRRRAARTGAEKRDAGTLYLVWGVISIAIAASVWVANHVATGRYALLPWIRLLALVVFLAGLALRWWAILTLGRLFTVDVAIHAEHRLVASGPYRLLRHPSYTGALLIVVAIGLSMGSALALATLWLPITLVLLRRIQVEERALAERFGDEWRAHCARTWRLVPFVW